MSLAVHAHCAHEGMPVSVLYDERHSQRVHLEAPKEASAQFDDREMSVLRGHCCCCSSCVRNLLIEVLSCMWILIGRSAPTDTGPSCYDATRDA